ncbi:hypothetical protein HMPREF9098_2010 [Kingella denitrificans ATCC 33394]|uniref:Uncharacterized protein n=1 Tax=Kingella denitrificans ATCC 33394 TaxID=888741 RepID=F0F1M5_9NEIS|nr:hypothetical protein HMPREF9098_2010 [Kingella denitrificans ATCC 33394]
MPAFKKGSLQRLSFVIYGAKKQPAQGFQRAGCFQLPSPISHTFDSKQVCRLYTDISPKKIVANVSKR